jgi:hypothetical protein
MTNQNKHVENGYQSSASPKRNIGGGYQPIANGSNQNEKRVLPPIPHGGSGESGRNGDRVPPNKK